MDQVQPGVFVLAGLVQENVEVADFGRPALALQVGLGGEENAAPRVDDVGFVNVVSESLGVVEGNVVLNDVGVNVDEHEAFGHVLGVFGVEENQVLIVDQGRVRGVRPVVLVGVDEVVQSEEPNRNLVLLKKRKV